MGDPERKFGAVVTEEFADLLESRIAAESLFGVEEGAAVVPSGVKGVDLRGEAKRGSS